MKIFRLTHNQAVRSLQFLNHILLICGIIYLLTNQAFLPLVYSVLIFMVIGTLGINIYLHRLISHRSFKTHLFFERVFGIISVLTTVGSPIAWAAVHRQHHRSADRDDDPHSPYKIGAWKAWFGLWKLPHFDLKLVRDLKKDLFIRYLHNNYFKIILVYCTLLFVINPLYVIFFYAIPACICLHSTSAIVVIAHKHGYITHPLKFDKARNSWIASILALGEGWHNNHHARPYMWNTQEKWWEFDPPSLIIRLIKIDK